MVVFYVNRYMLLGVFEACACPRNRKVVDRIFNPPDKDILMIAVLRSTLSKRILAPMAVRSVATRIDGKAIGDDICAEIAKDVPALEKELGRKPGLVSVLSLFSCLRCLFCSDFLGLLHPRRSSSWGGAKTVPPTSK